MWFSSAWSKRGEAGGGSAGLQARGPAGDLREAGADLTHSFPTTRDLPALGITLAGHQKKLLHHIQLLQRHLRELGSLEV